jgi:conjugal transfer/entry exclusion protein
MTTRRQILPCAAGALAAIVLPTVLTLSRPARAIPVIDVAGIGQIVLQWIQVQAQVRATANQVAELQAAARQLDPRSYQSVQNLLTGNDVNYTSLLRDVRTMGYALDRVNAMYERYFPNEEAVKAMKPAEFESTAREMNREVYDSALVAARAQTTLRTIEDNNIEARNVLSRSEGNGSQVAQLQAALQMLGLIHQNLVTINQLVSSAGRVTSNVAVRGITQRRIEHERGDRMLRDHDKDEAIPTVDNRFLKSW